MVDVAKKEALQAIMLSLTEERPAQWFTDAKAREAVLSILAEHGLNADAIATQALQ
jgi:hypothetical protein